MRNRRSVPELTILALLLLGLPVAATGQAPPRNVLLILMDDIGEDSFEWYLSQGDLPSIEDLIEDGIRFRKTWSNSLCSPTRATILTGLYGFRTGVLANAEKTPLREPVDTIAEVLQAVHPDFRTAVFGKWHLTEDGNRCDLGPTQYGFDSFQGSYRNLFCADYSSTSLVLPCCTSYLCVDKGDQNTDYWNYERTICSKDSDTGLCSCQLDDPMKGDPARRQTNWDDPDLHATNETTALAMSWISEATAAGDPWFALASFNAAHAPWQPVPWPDPATDKGGFPCSTAVCRTEKQEILIQHMDHRIGELYDLILTDPALSQRTVIILVGDNGTPGKINTPPAGSPRARGDKGSLHEGGINVPLIISTPSTRATGGWESDALANTTDLFPTAVELALEPLGITPAVPEHARSLAPALDTPGSNVRLFAYADAGRDGMHRATIRNERYKLILYQDPTAKPELFDLNRAVNDDETTEDENLLPIESSGESERVDFECLCRAMADLNGRDWDQDGDGVADLCCSATAYTIDSDGDGEADLCDADAPVDPDTDGDGLLDSCDPCPNGPLNVEDWDGDGFPESCDTCPGVYNPDQSTQGCFGLRS